MNPGAENTPLQLSRLVVIGLFCVDQAAIGQQSAGNVTHDDHQLPLLLAQVDQSQLDEAKAAMEAAGKVAALNLGCT